MATLTWTLQCRIRGLGKQRALLKRLRCQASVIRPFSATGSRTLRGEDCYFRDARTRDYLALAIETSCDDTSVALVELQDASWHELDRPDLLWYKAPVKATHKRWALRKVYHEKVTANSEAYGGIHPIVALESHRANLALLVQKAFKTWREEQEENDEDEDDSTEVPPLKFVAVTRGPGMRSNLAVGLDTAKGIATALNVPLLGVHHMQAHALTPRLISALENAKFSVNDDDKFEPDDRITELQPAFPFLSVLVSGGHTMLIDSQSLTEHATLAETQDIALGEFLDKAARVIVPPQLLQAPYGRAFEHFAFQSVVRIRGEEVLAELDHDVRCDASSEYAESCQPRYEYDAPKTQQALLERRSTNWGWSLTPPLVERKGGESKRMEYSFAGLLTYVERLVEHAEETGSISLTERQALAREAQRVAFEHLASRILLHLSSPEAAKRKSGTIVVSGGVAANMFLRHLLRNVLDARGFKRTKLAFPPAELATDNALMIAWAGIEMWDAGWTSQLSIGPIRKWSMDPKAPDGGILGADGWVKREDDADEEEEEEEG